MHLHMQLHASLRPPHTLYTLTHTSVHLCAPLPISVPLCTPPGTFVHFHAPSIPPITHLHTPPCTSSHLPTPSTYLSCTSTYLCNPLCTSTYLYTVLCIALYTLCPPPHIPLSTLHLHTPLHAPL